MTIIVMPNDYYLLKALKQFSHNFFQRSQICWYAVRPHVLWPRHSPLGPGWIAPALTHGVAGLLSSPRGPIGTFGHAVCSAWSALPGVLCLTFLTQVSPTANQKNLNIFKCHVVREVPHWKLTPPWHVLIACSPLPHSTRHALHLDFSLWLFDKEVSLPPGRKLHEGGSDDQFVGSYVISASSTGPGVIFH